MSISKDEVIHMAKLSKLALSDIDVEKLTSQLSNILDMANELSNIDVEGVEPTAHILDIKNVLREDKIEPSYAKEKILKNAPAVESGCVCVPQTIE